MRWLRTYILSPPVSALCFACFWAQGLAASWFIRDPVRALDVAPFWCRMLLKTAGVRVRAEGLDNIGESGAYVLVANHLSLADPPLLIAYLPGRVRFMFKDSLLKMPLIGAHLRRSGHIGVSRDDPRGAAKSLAGAARSLESQAASILIFAEGTRGEGEDLQAFRGGAAHLAIKTGAAVVPIGIWGTPDALPKGAFFLRPASVGLVAGDPISTAGLAAKDREQFTEALRAQVEKLRGRAMELGSRK